MNQISTNEAILDMVFSSELHKGLEDEGRFVKCQYFIGIERSLSCELIRI